LEYGREGEAQVLTGHRYFKYFLGLWGYTIFLRPGQGEGGDISFTL